MTAIIEMLIVAYLCLAFIVSVIGLANEFFEFTDGLIVKTIYNTTDMNVFGCIISTLFLYIVMPFYLIPRLVVIFIYWIFHVGRRKTNDRHNK